MRRLRNVKIILSHGGGTLPYIAERPALLLPDTPFGEHLTEESFLEDARAFYFDTALSSSKSQIAALKAFAAPGHILFGSDFPYAPPPCISKFNSRLVENLADDPVLAEEISFKSALRLFPRLAEQHK